MMGWVERGADDCCCGRPDGATCDTALRQRPRRSLCQEITKGVARRGLNGGLRDRLVMAMVVVMCAMDVVRKMRAMTFVRGC